MPFALYNRLLVKSNRLIRSFRFSQRISGQYKDGGVWDLSSFLLAASDNLLDFEARICGLKQFAPVEVGFEGWDF